MFRLQTLRSRKRTKAPIVPQAQGTNRVAVEFSEKTDRVPSRARHEPPTLIEARRERYLAALGVADEPAAVLVHWSHAFQSERHPFDPGVAGQHGAVNCDRSFKGRLSSRAHDSIGRRVTLFPQGT